MNTLITFLDDLASNDNLLSENILKVKQFFNSALDSEIDKICDEFAHLFPKWYEKVLIDEPIPCEIVGLLFGLFEQPDGVMLYAAGSDCSNDDPDWAVEPKYFPKDRYFRFPPFLTIRSTAKARGVEMWVLVLSLTLILVRDYLRTNFKTLAELFENRDFFVGIGFDDGDIYIVKK